jgi:hypothetical protein
MKKLIYIILALIVSGAIYVWFFLYNKPHVDVASKKADVVISANDLIQQFSDNPQEQHQKLLNKIIEISADKIQIIDKDSFQIAQIKVNSYPYVIEAALLHDIPETEISNAKIKGIYVGYLEAEPDFGLDGSIQLKRSVIIQP